MEFEYSKHALEMAREREINQDWVESTLRNPIRVERKNDGTKHYIKPIEEFGSRYLRVIINCNVTPHRIVTFYLDRRLRRQNEN